MVTIKPNQSRTKKDKRSQGQRPNNNMSFDKKANYKDAGYQKRSNYKFDFEDMDEDKQRFGTKSNKSRESAKSKIPPDQRPDKYDAKKRHERERKVAQRKHIDQDGGREKRPIKHKNNSKTNWTKYYQVGMLDEDEYADY
ncbi:MAG: hypothetical protein GX319_06025 [Clostridiales bacterium]|nr:hypothetical protein [Bacillota bacterium]NLK03951.1 hypothetical protein [Clostridiales bacterium]